MKFLPEYFEQIKQYENKWIALTHPDEEIVGSGDDAAQALRDAETKGYTDVFLYKLFPFDQFYIGSNDIRLS
jgi:hypothetical protein